MGRTASDPLAAVRVPSGRPPAAFSRQQASDAPATVHAHAMGHPVAPVTSSAPVVPVVPEKPDAPVVVPCSLPSRSSCYRVVTGKSVSLGLQVVTFKPGMFIRAEHYGMQNIDKIKKSGVILEEVL